MEATELRLEADHRAWSPGWLPVAIIVAFGAVATWGMWAVRLDYGPDEPAHLEYVHTMAWHLRPPTVFEQGGTLTRLHPPVYYAVLAVLWRLIGVRQEPASIVPGKEALQFLTSRSILGRRVLRLTSVLLGCLTLAVIARLLAALDVVPSWRPYLLALPAAWPMLQYLSSVVTNDNLAIAYSALACLAAVKLVCGGHCSLRSAALLGALAALGMYVKRSVLFVVPVGLWAVWMTSERPLRLRCMVLYLVTFVGLGVWWPLHDWFATGSAFPGYLPGEWSQDSPLHIILTSAHSIVRWPANLLLTAYMPDWSTDFVGSLVPFMVGAGAAAGGLAVFLLGLRRRQDVTGRRIRALSMAAMVILLAGVVSFCYLVDWRTNTCGRFLLAGLPWYVALLGSVVRRPCPEEGAGESPAVPFWVPGLLGALVILDAGWWTLASSWFAALGWAA